jgi:hypothetical protein
MTLRVLAALLVITQLASSSTDFHVSPAGSDANPGTRDRPLKTLERAREAVRRARSDGTRGEITIWLHSGQFQLARTFDLGSREGGFEDGPTNFRAAPGEMVKISGGKQVPVAAFHPVKDESTLRRLDPLARPYVLEADLKALGITDYGTHRQFGHGHPVVPAPMELFWNDSVLHLARYPNEGGILMGEVVEPGSVPRIGDYSNRGGTFRYTDGRHARWSGVQDVWLQGFFHHGFADDKIRIASIDTVRRQITLATPHMYGLGSGENFNLYVALNLLEELDQPGEWYVDRSTGKLYLWPPGDLQAARITVSLVEGPLIAIEAASWITLRDLTVECGRGLGVSMEGGSHNRIVDCTVRNFGTAGIMLGQGAKQTFPHITADDYEGVGVSREVGSYHAHLYRNSAWERNAGNHHTIERCEISNTGSGGIFLGGGSKVHLTPGDNAVVDCRIHDFDRRNKAGAAGVIVDGCANRVEHNEISNGDLQAIIVHGNDHTFEFNHIHHVARNSNDASAWYLGRDPSDQGNVVRWNFFHDVGRPDRKWTMGVYCDDATCGVRVEGNVFYRVASYGTVYSNGGHDIVVRNNIFIEGFGPAYQLKSMWYDFGMGEIPYFFSEKGIYTVRLTKSVNIRMPPYCERYPLLADWLDLLPDGKTFVGMRPRRNVFDKNVLVKHEETFRLVGKYAQTEFGDNYITQNDPGFVDAAKLDFRLKDDSVVYRELPGFEKIPFEKIGPR